MTGKLSWLAYSTRPDLSYTALAMSKKNNSAKIKDFGDISRVLKTAMERYSKLKFSRIRPKEDLVILGIGDASFKSDDKAVGGVMLFLSNSSMTRAVPIYWNSKTISKICYSSKDMETINVATMMEDGVFAARKVKILIFGDYKRRIKVRLFTDSEATLESIALSKQEPDKLSD